MDLDKYMSCEEAEEKWNVTSAWVRTLCRKGEIECVKVRNAWFVLKDQPNPKKERG